MKNTANYAFAGLFFVGTVAAVCTCFYLAPFAIETTVVPDRIDMSGWLPNVVEGETVREINSKAAGFMAVFGLAGGALAWSGCELLKNPRQPG